MALADVLVQVASLRECLGADPALKVSPAKMHIGHVLRQVPAASEHTAA